MCPVEISGTCTYVGLTEVFAERDPSPAEKNNLVLSTSEEDGADSIVGDGDELWEAPLPLCPHSGYAMYTRAAASATTSTERAATAAFRERMEQPEVEGGEESAAGDASGSVARRLGFIELTELTLDSAGASSISAECATAATFRVLWTEPRLSGFSRSEFRGSLTSVGMMLLSTYQLRNVRVLYITGSLKYIGRIIYCGMWGILILICFDVF